MNDPETGNGKLESVPSEAEHFYSGAAARITQYMLVLAVLGVAITGWRMGIWFAAGFLLGCLIAYVNFCWLKRAVNALAERATGGGRHEGGSGVFIRFLLRYGLIAIAAYAIFNISTRGLYGMLAGLFLPVGAIACEAAYEGYMALRRGL
jgi:hypothetical protein